jgi:hypothetical protein
VVVPEAAANTPGFPIAAVDAAGTVYLVWDEDRATPQTGESLVDAEVVVPVTYLSADRDHGKTWSKPVRVSPEGKPSIFPWTAAGAPGRVVVAWYEGDYGTPSNRVPNVWHVAAAVSTTADADKPGFKHAFVSEDPDHVGPIRTEGIFCSLTGADRSLLGFFEVRILPDGSPVLACTADADAHEATLRVKATRMVEGTSLR